MPVIEVLKYAILPPKSTKKARFLAYLNVQVNFFKAEVNSANFYLLERSSKIFLRKAPALLTWGL
jgi:hypothetical protein